MLTKNTAVILLTVPVSKISIFHMENLSPAYFEKQKALLSCIDVEIAAADIYKSFMKMFPSERDFWAQLALEEEDHARLYLAGDILQVTGEYSGIKFPLPAFIGRTVEFAEQIKEEIWSRPITLKEALDMALKLEMTITESIIFELPDNTSPVIANIRKIINDTESHVDRIEKLRIEKGFSLTV